MVKHQDEGWAWMIGWFCVAATVTYMVWVVISQGVSSFFNPNARSFLEHFTSTMPIMLGAELFGLYRLRRKANQARAKLLNEHTTEPETSQVTALNSAQHVLNQNADRDIKG